MEKNGSLLTIGYQGASIREFMRRIKSVSPDFLIDVRSKPSRNRDFGPLSLDNNCRAAGLKYVNFGHLLGGFPEPLHRFLDQDGYIDYRKMLESRNVQKGLLRLEYGLSKGFDIAIMCYEKYPAHCHRSKLVGREISKRGFDVRHLLVHSEEYFTQEQVDDNNGNSFRSRRTYKR